MTSLIILSSLHLVILHRASCILHHCCSICTSTNAVDAPAQRRIELIGFDDHGVVDGADAGRAHRRNAADFAAQRLAGQRIERHIHGGALAHAGDVGLGCGSVVSTRSAPRSPSVTIAWPGDTIAPDRTNTVPIVPSNGATSRVFRQLRFGRVDGGLRLFHARFGHGDLFRCRAGLQQIQAVALACSRTALSRR